MAGRKNCSGNCDSGRGRPGIRAQRHRLGALEFDRIEAAPVMSGGRVTGIVTQQKNRANDLIEDFMVAANMAMAQTLKNAGCCAIQRVVKSPERWGRIVELAAKYGETLPAQPDSGALAAFLRAAKGARWRPVRGPVAGRAEADGPGEYAVVCPNETAGHFGLAAHDYTHSTAPNRRFADLVTQRLVKPVLQAARAVYASGARRIAANCTLKESAARKVERTMNKSVAAVALADRVGQSFAGVVTGVTPKGTFVRVLDPPAEGRLIEGENGVDVGDQVRRAAAGDEPGEGVD